MLTVAQCSTSGDTIGLLQLWERLRAQRRMRLLCSLRLSRAIGLRTSDRPVLLLVGRILRTVPLAPGDSVSVGFGLEKFLSVEAWCCRRCSNTCCSSLESFPPLYTGNQ